MTNEEIIAELLDHGLNEAADLIERLQRERDEARDRRAEVERERDANNKFARKHHSEGFFEGFRAGIEAAYEASGKYHQITHIREAIRALSPSDKPAAPSVAEAARVLLDWAAEEYIVDSCVPQENREPGCASCDLLRAFEIIADGLADYKTEDTKLHHAIRALAAREDKPAVPSVGEVIERIWINRISGEICHSRDDPGYHEPHCDEWFRVTSLRDEGGRRSYIRCMHCGEPVARPLKAHCQRCGKGHSRPLTAREGE